MKKVHHLKILPEYFKPVRAGVKTFEIRNNGRDFKSADVVLLKEWDGEYTGAEISATIGYVTSYGQQEGTVVFSLLGVKEHGQ